MNSPRLLWVAGLLCCVAGCASDKETVQMSADGTGPAAMNTPPPLLGPPTALANHMHLHAGQLRDLNEALDAGNLEAAGTPAYWLSRHRTVDLPGNWGPHIEKMHDEARAVEEATDLATARAAAKRLENACRGCHEANNRDIDLPTGAGR